MRKKPTYEELEKRVRQLEDSTRQKFLQDAPPNKRQGRQVGVNELVQKNEEKYRTILDGIEDSYLEVDLNGNFIAFNKAFCRLLGFSKADLMGRNNREFLDQKNALKVYQIFNTVYETGEPANGVSWELKRKDGSKRIIEASVSLVTDPTGNRTGFRGIGRDITKRQKAEARLHSVLERTDSILQTIQSGLFIIDAATHEILDVNQAAEEMIGENRERIIGRICHQFVCPAEQGKCPYKIKQKKSIKTEAVLLRKDGRTVDILKTVSAAVLDGRECLVESFVDISGVKKAEAAARAHQERFKIFFSSVNDAIFVHPLKKEGFAPFIEVNDIACKRYGYTRDEFLKLTAMDITKKTDVKMHAASDHRKNLLETRHQVFEAIHIKKNREAFPVEINSNIVDQFGKPVILAVVRDISDRKRAEAEKAYIESQYRQARKVEAIGRLAGGVAHDLNNILSPIIGYGEMLMDEIGQDDDKWDSVDQIVKASYRARDIVRQLLAFGRKQTLEYKTVNLNEIIKDFEVLLRRTIREDIEIDILPSPDRLPIKADIGQIEQVIMNLAVNAQDAMKKGGKMTIRTSLIELGERLASNRPGMKPGENVLLSITDTGCGIPEEIRENIFEPFFSSKGKKGTGLGLATVYGIVKQHGGYIDTESEIGKGTTFRIFLPAIEDVLPKKEIGEHSPAKTEGSETILLVEDNAQVRKMSYRVLKRRGYNVIATENGAEALMALSERNGNVDLLLTDVIMPEMNGKDLFEKAAATYPDIKVLYMSGYTDDVIGHHGVLEPGVQFIPKPFRVKELEAKVRDVLDQSK